MDIYRLDEVAKKLRVSDATVRDVLRSGALRSVRVGLQWRVTDEALKEYLHAAPTPPRPTGPRTKRAPRK
jgi:excisionase family DNA binding protein